MALAKKDKANNQRFTWDSFMKYYNDLIDYEIISFCKDKKYSYYGGKCTLSSEVKEDEFSKTTFLIIVSVLYYNESGNEKVIERKITSRFNYREFIHDIETLTKLRKLLKESEEMNIEAPNRGGE